MEILKPSDKLEQQLVDDAKKKAERILKNADNDSERILKEEISRAEKEIEILEKNEQQEIAKITNEIKAVLPLDIMRKRLGFINNAINSVLNEFFDEIAEEEFLNILKSSVVKVKDIFKGLKVHLKYKDVTEKKLKELITGNIPEISILNASSEAVVKGFILESEDLKVTYRCTVLELKNYLLENYREELVKELFEGRI